MGKTINQAVLYVESEKSEASGAKVLTRGKTGKKPDEGLRGKKIDVLAGRFWIADLPDLTKENEAFLEVNVITREKGLPIPHSFKLNVEVQDNSFSSNIAGAEIITGATVTGTGVELQCRLTEMDENKKDKLSLIKNFIDSNDIPGISQALIHAKGLPINPRDVINIFFNTVELIDELNDDDRIWIERPKLDLRDDAENPLYEGWYALVNTTKSDELKLPMELYQYGGRLYKEFTSETDNKNNTPFEDATYFSWEILAR